MNGIERHIIIGAGGTGSHLIAPLIAYLNTRYESTQDWMLFIVDGDSVEKKNFERQLFQPAAIMRNKALALANQYSATRNVHAVQEYLSESNIDRLISDGDYVYICVDNYPVRALIEKYCATLGNVVVINGGNEKDTGSCQIWIRKNGQDITPKLSFLHPEILAPGENRAEMTCQQIAELPGGEQLIVANMASAMFMLTALISFHQKEELVWTEIQFDLGTNRVAIGMDQREFMVN